MTAFPSIHSPRLGVVETTQDNSLRSDSADGSVITRKRRSRQLHHYELHWEAMSYTDVTTLKSFYASVNGGAGAFTWTDDFGTTRNVIFDGDIIYHPVSINRFIVDVRLQEI